MGADLGKASRGGRARDVLSFPRHGANYKPVLERVSNKKKKKRIGKILPDPNLLITAVIKQDLSR